MLKKSAFSRTFRLAGAEGLEPIKKSMFSRGLGSLTTFLTTFCRKNGKIGADSSVL